jgi:multiple sugar transport system ATP-binding protein
VPGFQMTKNAAGAQDAAPVRLAVDLNNAHLLNEVIGVVL